MKETLKRADEITSWYQDRQKDYSGLEDLMDKADELAALRSTLCTEMGQAHKDWLGAKSTYQNRLNQMWISLKSKYKAEANSSRQYSDMNEKEGKYRYLKARIEGIDGVMERMNQRISQLKEEWKLAKYTK